MDGARKYTKKLGVNVTRKEHKAECVEKLGNDWNKVHAWLDASARDYFPFVAHRQLRHHRAGVKQIRAMWGDEAAKAAELHIISDEGRVPTTRQIQRKYGPLPSKKTVSAVRAKHGIS